MREYQSQNQKPRKRAMTPRMARYLLSGLLIQFLLTGCQYFRPQSTHVATTRSAQDAPAFGLSIEDKPVISTVSHRLEPDIEIVDSRDDVQKWYYPGESAPQRYRDAVSVLPLESFRPGFDRQLRGSVVAAMTDPLRYASVQIELKSFFVTLDTREQTYEKLLYEYKKWDDDVDERERQREEQRRLNERAEDEAAALRQSLNLPERENEQGNGLGAKVGRFVWDRGIVDPIRKSLRRREQRQRLQATPQSIPAMFTTDRTEGWNCHIEVDITVVVADGTPQTVTLAHDTRAPHAESRSTTEQGKAIVIRTLSEMTDLLRARGL